LIKVFKMKKLFLILILALPIVGLAQTANKYQVDRAKLFSDYVAKNMELTEDDTAFIHQVFLDRVVNASKKIKGKGLSQEQKREIYTEEYANAKNKLTDRFGKKMANKVMSLSNKARKEADTR
tara:strand:- start:1249 stop:1617 length:369 start_codon:yes stop_codon:yes gene_type:complete